MDTRALMGLLVVVCLLAIVLLSVIMVTIIFTKDNSKRKYIQLHTWSNLFLVLGIIVLGIFGISTLKNRIEKPRKNVSTIPSSTITNTKDKAEANGFTIEEFKVEMNVDDSNSIEVNEMITVNFYEKGHHGIYRFIPSTLEYTDKDGNTQYRTSSIENLKATGDKYKTYMMDGKKEIRIGDENYLIPIGNHTYKISYIYNMGSDPYEGFDELIFHAFGDYWGTEIKNAAITIHLPKALDTQDNIKFFADKYRTEEITTYVNYSIDGNTIYAKLSPDYDLMKSLTIDIELPDGYFLVSSNVNNISSPHENMSLILCIVCISLAIGSFILWLKYGKDIEIAPTTMNHYPPKDLDAAEIGYLYKKDSGKKLAIALIIELASKGYIKISESREGNILTITKTRTTDINKYIKRKVKIIKLKEYKDSLFNPNYEAKKIMDTYFPENTNEGLVASNVEDFYEKSKYLVENGYIQIKSDNINKYSQEKLEEIRKKLVKNEFKDKPKMSVNEKKVYNILFEDSDEIILSENHNFYKVFSEITENVRNTYNDKINDFSVYKYMLISSYGFLISTISWVFSYGIYNDLKSAISFLYFIAFISVIASLLFTILMERKTLYGAQIKANIESLKKDIETIDKNKIEELTKKDPNYFYEILPYAYILGVSKKWIEKFDNIPNPVSDMGSFNYGSTDSIHNIASYIYMPQSGGNSSCGAGCSSCGGGCSSCGGGGSW